MENLLYNLSNFAKLLHEWVKDLIPSELQVMLRLISMTTVTVRLLKLVFKLANWVKNRIVIWSQQQSLMQEKSLSEQTLRHKRFDYTYIEGLIKELEDKVDNLEKQRKSKAEILMCILIEGIGIFSAVVVMAWDSLFTKQKPKS